MKSCDVDGDGMIDYVEFVSAAIDHRALINKENIQSIFNLFDANGDGSITMEELTGVFKGPNDDNDAHLEQLKAIMKEVDTNNDGEISFEEFNEAITKMLKDD
jgi:calcium-dependent protein kinase